MLRFPPRYLPVRRLGQGGGGEVWEVEDKITARRLAFKVLAPDAGEHEVLALVREASALSGLEGLGVPHVVDFGSLLSETSNAGTRTARRYLVREMVEGQSLEDLLDDEREDAADWLEPLAQASEQLTVLHRSGLLHGDIKPANVIVGPSGRGTLVDLGLAAPLREGGTLAAGLTPKYAAPELMAGEPLTVRAEVYALGATLSDGLARRGSSLPDDVRLGLVKIAARATEGVPTARYPSVDELASALRRTAGLKTSPIGPGAAWPIVGLDATAQALKHAAAALGPGEGLAVEGPRGSGRTTLVKRLAWTLGAEGRAVATIDRPRGNMTAREAVELELRAWDQRQGELVIVVDDVDVLDAAAKLALSLASERGARLVGVGTRDQVGSLAKRRTRTFDVPPLDTRAAEELVGRAVPSLPDALRAHLVKRLEGRPGRLRAFLRRLGSQAVVSAEDVDAILAAPSSSAGTIPPSSSLSRPELLATIERALDQGRIGEAAQALDELGGARDKSETGRVAIARARVLLGRGEAPEAARLLETSRPAAGSPLLRAWGVARARAALRMGDYAGAAAHAARVTDDGPDDALRAEAMAIHGGASTYTGEHDKAREELERAVALAEKLGDKRAVGMAQGMLAIAHQRAGRTKEARGAYEASLAAAEAAGDAATVAAMRQNLAGLAQAEGDFAAALGHYEAAVDMGRRSGVALAVQQALMNLAVLDVFLGRYARASASVDALVAEQHTMGPLARAQLLGIEAELATRTGDVVRGAELYDECAVAYEPLDRPLEVIEARLEALYTRARHGKADPGLLARDFEHLKKGAGEGGFREHAVLASLVEGTLALSAGDEATAARAFDHALGEANTAGNREWAWRALDARARLAASQGAVAHARRDTEAALAMLEETAAKLPRDLREVFWDDPRRRALRQAHTATIVAPPPSNVPATGRSATIRQSVTAGTTTMTATVVPEDRLAYVLEITRELAREHDLSRLLAKVTDHAVALLRAERGFVVLANEHGELLAHAARDRKGDDPHAHFSRSVAEKVVQTGEPVLAVSARDDASLAQAVSVHQLMIQSIACVPIRGAPPVGRPIGALYVETRLRPGLRFQEELPTLLAFGDQAAIAIENARLLEENHKRAAELANTNQELAAAKDRLAEILERRTEQLGVARRDLKQARAELRSHFGYHGLVGTSSAMRKVYATIERIKDTDVPILITGESGTGKEMVARAVHAAGARAKAAFLGVNCGAIPGNLLESELFGHVRGAFTGADRDRKGLFREAEGGTILLDEIGEMPVKMQAGLLRVLQEKTVRPVGGVNEEPVDARVIAATNRGLEQMVQEGLFREDLFYRLHVIEVRVPSLRERTEDIPPLMDHFMTIFAARYRREKKSLSREALRRMVSYEWPGNVRQLEHVLLNAWLMSEGDEILPEDLQITEGSRSRPSSSSSSSGTTTSEAEISSIRPSSAPSGPVARTKEEFKDTERERILNALSSCNWNRVQAAKLIGIPRRTFYRRLKEYGIL
jgi:serine/threonine-protein kinase PknK